MGPLERVTARFLRNSIVLASISSGMIACVRNDSIAAPASAVAQPPPVFRDPFTLKVRIDRERYFEAKYENRVPYVADGDVYLFPGESFGLKVVTSNGEISSIEYVKDRSKADIELDFAQDPKNEGDPGMILTMTSHLGYDVGFSALMVRPGDGRIRKTSVLPLRAGLTHFEGWPDPIAQLVLRHLHVHKEPVAPKSK